MAWRFVFLVHFSSIILGGGMIQGSRSQISFNKIIKDWGRDYTSQRQTRLNARRRRGSGALTNSFRRNEITNNGEIEAVLFRFLKHGRYRDMKKLAGAEGGEEYVKEIIEWIKDKGLYDKLVDGWIDRNTKLRKNFAGFILVPVLPPDIERRLAWGIIRSRANREPDSAIKYRHRWYNASRTAAIADLKNQIIAAMPSAVLDDVARQIKNP